MLHLFFPYEYAESVFTIDYEALLKQGFKALIFDIDNTLVHHGDDCTKEIEQLFQALHKMGFKTLLLSDNEDSRVSAFCKGLDSLYISLAKKPSVKAYKKALCMLGVSKNEAVVLGDQIFLDILGANRAHIPSILIKFIRLKEETYFGKRRDAENVILKLYYKRKKYVHRLGNIEKKGL